jgi:hypothetical protein
MSFVSSSKNFHFSRDRTLIPWISLRWNRGNRTVWKALKRKGIQILLLRVSIIKNSKLRGSKQIYFFIDMYARSSRSGCQGQAPLVACRILACCVQLH